jgi:hypothetical protein
MLSRIGLICFAKDLLFQELETVSKQTMRPSLSGPPLLLWCFIMTVCLYTWLAPDLLRGLARVSSGGGLPVSANGFTQISGKSVRWLEDASRFPDSLEVPIHGWVASKRPARSGGDEVKGGEAVNDRLGDGHELEAGAPRLGRSLGLLIAPVRKGNT